MKTIGLIGGMSWESTALYYRFINEMVRDRLGGLASAEILIRSINFERIVSFQLAGAWDRAADELIGAGLALERAGADCVLICTNTMHLVAGEVRARLATPLIDIIEVTADALIAQGRRRPLLLATRYTMEHGFYSKRMAARGIDVLVPDACGRMLVHDVIFDELCLGSVRQESHDRLMGIVGEAHERGADSVIFGCTEIGMILKQDELPLPGFDSARLHAERAVEFSIRSRLSEAA